MTCCSKAKRQGRSTIDAAKKSTGGGGALCRLVAEKEGGFRCYLVILSLRVTQGQRSMKVIVQGVTRKLGQI